MPIDMRNTNKPEYGAGKLGGKMASQQDFEFPFQRSPQPDWQDKWGWIILAVIVLIPILFGSYNGF